MTYCKKKSERQSRKQKKQEPEAENIEGGDLDGVLAFVLKPGKSLSPDDFLLTYAPFSAYNDGVVEILIRSGL